MRMTVRGFVASSLLLMVVGMAPAGWGLFKKSSPCDGGACAGGACDGSSVTSQTGGFDASHYSAIPTSPAPGTGRCGWHPCLRKCFHLPDPICVDEAKPAPSGPPPQAGGTLVFPNFMYNRSPRDYFME